MMNGRCGTKIQMPVDTQQQKLCCSYCGRLYVAFTQCSVIPCSSSSCLCAQPQEEPEELIAARAKLADSKMSQGNNAESGVQCYSWPSWWHSGLRYHVNLIFHLAVQGVRRCKLCIMQLNTPCCPSDALAAADDFLVALPGATATAESPTAAQPLQELSVTSGNVEKVERQSEPQPKGAHQESQETASASQPAMQAQPDTDGPAALFAKAGHEVTSVVASGLSDDESDAASEQGSLMTTSTPYEELD